MQGPWDRYRQPSAPSGQREVVIPPDPSVAAREDLERSNIEGTIGARAADQARQPTPGEAAGDRDLNRQNTQSTIADRELRAARLPDAMLDDLNKSVSAFGNLERAVSGFQDDYGGFGAGLENWAQQYAQVGTEGQRGWWSRFYEADNIARNQLFGASLSDGERAAFERTTVSPNMSPEEIRRNLNDRRELALSSLRRRVNVLRAGGYSNEQINAALGEYLSFLDQAEAAAPAMAQAEGQAAPQEGQPAIQQAAPQGPPSITDVDRSSRHAAPGSTPDTELANGGTRLERDPALRGVNRRIGNMMVRGASDDEIRAYVNSLGLGPSVGPSLEGALNFRRNQRNWNLWRRQNPNRAYPVEIEMREVPMSAREQVVANLADSAVGTHFASTANVLTGQRLDQIVGALGGDEEFARAGIEQIRREHPIAAFAGDATGGTLMAAGGTAALGRVGVTGLPAMLGTEAGIGAYQGQGLNREDPLMGAATGAAVGLGGGAVMRSGTGLGARAVAPTGGRLAPLYAEGVQPSVGQRAGGVVNRAEQALASVPVIGAAQRSTRERAIAQAERGVFNRALRNIPENRTANGASAQLPRDTQAGTQAWQHSYDAFDNAYNSVHAQMTFRLDNRVQQSLVDAQQAARRLSTDSANRFERIYADDVIRPLTQNNGSLNGQQLQSVLSNLRTTMRNVRNNRNGDPEFVEVLEQLEDALMRGAVRNSPREAIRDLRRIDRGYAQLMRAERAAMSGSANRDPGRFSANDLMRAERQQGSRRRFLRGEQEGAEYAGAWNRLGQSVNDSGTPERAAYMQMATGGALFGGSGAAGAGMHPLFMVPLAADTIANMPGVRVAVNALLDPARSSTNARFARDAIMRNRGLPGGAGAAGATNALLQDEYY